MRVFSLVREFLILVTLGSLRLVTVSATDYQTHNSEYGVHSNFFFVLAITKVIFRSPFYNLADL